MRILAKEAMQPYLVPVLLRATHLDYRTCPPKAKPCRRPHVSTHSQTHWSSSPPRTLLAALPTPDICCHVLLHAYPDKFTCPGNACCVAWPCSAPAYTTPPCTSLPHSCCPLAANDYSFTADVPVYPAYYSNNPA